MDAIDSGCAAETGLALGVRFVREVLQVEDAVIRIEFSHQPFGPIQVYEDFFGVPVHFQQASNAIVFRHSDLDKVPHQPDPELFRYIQEHLALAQQRLAKPTDSDELAQIRLAIAHNAEQSVYTAEALAQHLHMSLRALQRTAQKQGFTVRQLLDAAREANAKELLQDSRLSVEAIAFLLGYSDDRAFRRAFKRWTSKTPADFRRRL